MDAGDVIAQEDDFPIAEDPRLSKLDPFTRCDAVAASVDRKISIST